MQNTSCSEAIPKLICRFRAIGYEKTLRNAEAYFARHFGWMEVGEPQRALEDLNRSIEIEPKQIAWLCRGHVHRHLGQYQNALDDFQHGDSIDPEQWDEIRGPLYQADCHARLGYARIGNEPAALACWRLLPDEIWTPGPHGAPAGNKSQIAYELRRIAAAARSGMSAIRRTMASIDRLSLFRFSPRFRRFTRQGKCRCSFVGF